MIKKEETNDSKILQTLRTLIKTESGEDNPRKEKRDSMEQEIEEIIASSLAENEDKKEIGKTLNIHTIHIQSFKIYTVYL